MHSPFASKDPVVRRAGIILSFVMVVVLGFVLVTSAVEAQTQTIQANIISPARSWYTTKMHLMALEMAKISKQEQERALNEQQLMQARKLHQEFLRNQQNKATVEVKSETTVTNNGVTVKKNSVKQVSPAGNAEQNRGESIQFQPVPDQQPAPAPNYPAFDQKAWDEEIAKMKAESEARYQESLKNQQVWSDQKSAENAAWMDEQRAKAEAEQEKWREENGW